MADGSGVAACASEETTPVLTEKQLKKQAKKDAKKAKFEKKQEQVKKEQQNSGEVTNQASLSILPQETAAISPENEEEERR